MGTEGMEVEDGPILLAFFLHLGAKLSRAIHASIIFTFPFLAMC